MTNFINTYDQVKNLVADGNVRNIFNTVDYHFTNSHDIEYSDTAMVIMEIVAKYGEGFVIDICNRVLENNIQLTEKQRWCVAFAFLKITAEQIEEERAFNTVEADRLEAEVSKEEIIKEAEANVMRIEIDGTSLQIINRGIEVIIYDFDKWEDIERIANILHLDQFDRQPVIIKQRAGSAPWSWINMGNTWEGLHFENNINPITGEEDYSSYMKLTEDSTTYAIAIIIQK